MTAFLALFANKWVRIGGLILLFAAILFLARCDAYKDGVRETDVRWEAAGQKLKDKAANSASQADRNAAQRAGEFSVELKQEKAKVDEAVAQNRSAFDELFPSGL